MSRTGKSQWDFGELFPREELRRVESVTELTGRVKRLLEGEVGQVWVTGEITNLRTQSSGHSYFTLKDAGAQLNCVLFRSGARDTRHLLADGQKVVLQGEMTVYEPRGQYQLRVTAVELQGIGALQAAFEKLKQKLNAEGLFAAERKRPLPRYPQRMGVVTSPTGAAIRDILHVIRRRQPGLELVLVPCRVQGQGAGEEIADGIRLLNEFARAREGLAMAGESRAGLDLILVTRGGGSLEDLWAFNEEVVARAIHESLVPVVSAVGHEIDFTISDFVADFRAATPSAAAEVVTEGVHASRRIVEDAPARMRLRVRRLLAEAMDDLAGMVARMARVHPRRRLDEQFQRLDDLNGGLRRAMKHGVRGHQGAWQNLGQRLVSVKPSRSLVRRRDLVLHFGRRLTDRFALRLERMRSRLAALEQTIQLLSPEQALARGYSITTDAASSRVMRDASQARAGQVLRTRLQRGEVWSRVEEPGDATDGSVPT